jgi:ParB/RepB/Spo0J family partition protein
MGMEIKTVKCSDILVDHDFNSRVLNLEAKTPHGIELSTKEEGASVQPLQDLADSIKANGQMQPVLLRKLPPKSDKPYALVAGFRRFVAISQILGKTEINAQVYDMSEADAAMANLIENEVREDLSPYELASSVNRTIEKYKFSITDVAAKINRSQSYLNNLVLNLKNLHPIILDAWAGKKGAEVRKVCTMKNLNEWRGMEKDKQADAFERATGNKDKANANTGTGANTGSGEGTGEEDAPKQPKKKVRSPAEITNAREYFTAEPNGTDTISADGVKVVLAVLKWVTGEATDILGVDVAEYAKERDEKAKAASSEFEKFMNSPEAKEMLRKTFEAHKKAPNASAPGTVPAAVVNAAAPGKDKDKPAIPKKA